jgi:hypothetical protein
MKQSKWNELDPGFNCFFPSECQVDYRAIFQQHTVVNLEEDEDTHKQEMMKHVQDLHSKVFRYGYETAAGAVFIFSSLPHPIFQKFILMLANQPKFSW